MIWWISYIAVRFRPVSPAPFSAGSRSCAPRLVVWPWSPGPGRLSLVPWPWSLGLGHLALVVWPWSPGPGRLAPGRRALVANFSSMNFARLLWCSVECYVYQKGGRSLDGDEQAGNPAKMLFQVHVAQWFVLRTPEESRTKYAPKGRPGYLAAVRASFNESLSLADKPFTASCVYSFRPLRCYFVWLQ